jgi:pyruvate decarboxylase
MAEHTIGTYLATRLEQMGLAHYFVVPGDYNLVLLDELLTNPRLEQIGCCNELDAGYAADGYARARGAAAVVVTFSVGGLSAINAIAGAYAEDLPVLLVSGGPNTNDEGANHRLHHTLGTGDLSYQADLYRRVTCDAVVIKHPEDAPGLIDRAIRSALRERKPAYIEIACNLAGTPVPPPADFGALATPEPNDAAALAAAVAEVTAFLGRAVKPVLLAGVKLRSCGAIPAFRELAEALGCAVAVMPNAKGFFPEDHPQYIGTYWGTVSSLGCAEVVESSDAILAAGPTFNDYTTVGYSALLRSDRIVEAGPDRVRLRGGDHGGIVLADLLAALARRAQRNDTSLKVFERIRSERPTPHAAALDAPLTSREINRQIEDLLDPTTTLVAETGDSWFNGIKMRLPEGAAFEFQMQYGSIGWAVGATLGYALAAGAERRIVAMIGDGSFQLTAQELSTMIRLGLPVIIFLINNRGYTIEVEIHDGPYNNIKNWDYAGLVGVFNASDGDGLGLRATTARELAAAIERARQHRTGPTLIECAIDRDDCSKELLEWGSRVAAANARPPQRS